MRKRHAQIGTDEGTERCFSCNSLTFRGGASKMGWSLALAYGVAARAGAIPERKPRKRYEHGWHCERVQKCRDCKQQGCYEVKDRAATCSSERYIAAESPRCRRRLRLRRGSPHRSFPGSNPDPWLGESCGQIQFPGAKRPFIARPQR